MSPSHYSSTSLIIQIVSRFSLSDLQCPWPRQNRVIASDGFDFECWILEEQTQEGQLSCLSTELKRVKDWKYINLIPVISQIMLRFNSKIAFLPSHSISVPPTIPFTSTNLSALGGWIKGEPKKQTKPFLSPGQKGITTTLSFQLLFAQTMFIRSSNKVSDTCHLGCSLQRYVFFSPLTSYLQLPQMSTTIPLDRNGGMAQGGCGGARDATQMHLEALFVFFFDTFVLE